MKFIASFLFAGLLAGVVCAQGTPPPPADPPADPPKDTPPEPTTEWAKTWQAARNVAQKRNGYALMWVQADKLSDGKDAPHTSRLQDMYFNRPEVFHDLNEQFGCWKGTMSEAQQQGGKHLQDSNVKQGPAVIFVDPETGDVVDSYVGRFTYQEIGEVTKAVMEGNSRKKLEEKLKERENANDTKLHLLYGDALVRTAETADARKAYAVVMKSNDPREKIMAEVGLAWCDLKEKKYKDAIENSQKAMEQMPPMIPPRGTCLYIQVWAYYEQNELEECAKVARVLRETLIRTTHGWKANDDCIDLGYCFICKAKFAPGSPHQCPTGEEGVEGPK